MGGVDRDMEATELNDSTMFCRCAAASLACHRRFLSAMDYRYEAAFEVGVG